MYTDICKLFHIQYPIFQGAMAWISDSSLVSAVSEAGGLGVLATGHLDGEQCRAEIRRIRENTDKPFVVNIMLLSPKTEELVQVVCEEHVPVVTTGAGNPGRFMPAFREAGVKVVPVIPSVALAKRMEKEGADAVIAEGCESGGHVGKTTTMALVPQVVDAVNIPVLAAGGIADGRGMAAARMLGASGVQIGTRFLVSRECTVHQNYKDRILKARDIDTVTTGQSTGHPVRVLKNALTREYERLEREGASAEQIEELGRGRLRMAVVDGNTDQGSVMSGQIAGMVTKEQTAGEIIEEIMKEYTELMSAPCI